MCQYVQINLLKVCAGMYQNLCFTHLHPQDNSEQDRAPLGRSGPHHNRGLLEPGIRVSRGEGKI